VAETEFQLPPAQAFRMGIEWWRWPLMGRRRQSAIALMYHTDGGAAASVLLAHLRWLAKWQSLSTFHSNRAKINQSMNKPTYL